MGPGSKVSAARVSASASLSAVTFDLWHTLCYLEPTAEETYMQRQAAAACDTIIESPRKPGAGYLASDEIARLFDRELAGAVAAAGEGQTVTPEEQFRSTAEAAGREPMFDVYLERLGRVVRETPFVRAPGALELLESLRQQGYRLALISNTIGEPGHLLRPVLREMELAPYFEAELFSDEHPWAKPAPEIFRAALDRLGESPSEAVHVGDGWSDMEGSRRADFRGSILFTGLRSYGTRYQSLFVATGWDPTGEPHTAAGMEEVGRKISELLPIRPKSD